MEHPRSLRRSVGRPVQHSQMAPVQQRALDEALKVLDNAYQPYSGFSVGATLIAADGRLVSATNFENAAYGSTICAERAAVLKANSEGIRNVTGLALIARRKDGDTDEVVSPCGSCRQFLFELSELCDRDLEFILSTTRKDKIILATMTDLLPLGFGPKEMDVDISYYRK